MTGPAETGPGRPAGTAPPVAPSTALSADRRARELADLRERSTPVDLIVIGGGITGAGIALASWGPGEPIAAPVEALAAAR